METAVKIAIITALTLLAVVFMLKDVITKAECTEISFFESKISICDDTTAANLKEETKQLTNLIKELEIDYNKLKDVNKKLKSKLRECNESAQTRELLRADSTVNSDFLVLKPKLEIYKTLPDFNTIQARVN